METRLKAFFARITSVEYIPRYTRLAGDLQCYKPQLEKRIADTASEKAQWAIQTKALIEKSEQYLEKMKIDEGWKTFHAAQRLAINAMNDEERLSRASELRIESSKLNEWRHNSILQILGSEEEQKVPSPELLIRATELKDEHYNNQYYKNALSRNMFQLLFFLLFIFIMAIIVYFAIMHQQMGELYSEKMTMSGQITGVLLFGFLGAITSAILFTRYSTKFSKIAEISSNSIITLSKVFVGASFSIFIFLLLKSSVAENIQLFNFSINDPLDYFAIAFVSGFSERLAQKAIEAIVGKE